jgi:Holliday junction DNA helicase RuvA
VIRSLSGTVTAVGDEYIALDVSGFGLEVFASGSLLSKAVAGEFLTCAAYLQVTDSGMALFGFSDERERALFLELTQVKTMGGKLSIALLRHLDVETIVQAIIAEDSSRLAVQGLGPKRAERICFELKSKAQKAQKGFGAILGAPGLARTAGGSGSLDSGVAAGLVGLGFSQSEAFRAISSCKAEFPEREWTEETLMMSALTKMQRISAR